MAAKQNVPLLTFNRGEVSKHALGRLDVEQFRLAAETQINWVPLTLGPMMFRPGTKYLASTYNDSAAKFIPFVFAVDDTALLEFTDALMRIWVDDVVLTAPSVSTTIVNGDFSAAGSWTLSATPAGAASSAITGGLLSMNAEGVGSVAYAEQAVSVGASDIGVVHRLRVHVAGSSVTFQVGTTSDGEELFTKTTLSLGYHSLAFTPTGATFYVRLTTRERNSAQVASVEIEAAGDVTLPTAWSEANLSLIRTAQSADVIYATCEGIKPQQIERRDNNSWSIVDYNNTGGPFTSPPDWAKPIVMDPNFGGLVINTSFLLDSSAAYFKNTHVRSLVRVFLNYQTRQEWLAAQNASTAPIHVTGVTTEDREFSFAFSGTWVGTIALERSVLGPDIGYNQVDTYTVNGSTAIDDSTDFPNIECWYRLTFTGYTSGFAVCDFVYRGNAGTGDAGFGIANITAFVSSTEAQCDTIHPFPTSFAGYDWEPGEWSDEFGWPSACALYDGRLFFAGPTKLWGSVSDDYTNHDDTVEGESGPINRSFGSSTASRTNWLLPLSRLIVGRNSSEVSVRSSSLDAPLTPVDLTMKDCSSQGSAPLPAVKIDTSGVFVQQSGRRVYELLYSVENGDYHADDLSKFNFDIGEPGFVDIAVQRQPDTRIHLVRGDGMVAVLSHDRDNGVSAWWRVETDGTVENVVVLPGSVEDQVYYVVSRTINGQPKRFLEKFARQDECVGGTVNKIADCHVVYSGVSTATITGLDHLEGEEVVAWGSGKDLGSYAVASGSITLSEAVTDAVVGLSYSATFKSAKLGYGAAMGTALSQKKRVVNLGMYLVDTHYQGLEVGPDFDTMDFLPLVEEGTETPADTIWSQYDTSAMEFPGEWHTDSRLCLRATAPRPATVCAVAVGIQTNDK